MSVLTQISTKILVYSTILSLVTAQNDCNRPCDGLARVCSYTFQLEWFLALGRPCFDCPTVQSDCFRQDCIVAGGYQRGVTVINRMMPGPSIEVCQGDRVEVLLINSLSNAESTTIHWHGIRMSDNPYMDGVPYVTQCPIPYNNNFTYSFVVPEAGTYFYHSHTGSQRGEGTHGALIVRQPDSQNLLRNLYDQDLPAHIIQITDWTINGRLEASLRYWQNAEPFQPDSIIINGLGYPDFTDLNTSWPLARFTVRRGNRYRFRVINVGFNDCPLEIQIDNHQLMMVSTDGQDFSPTIVDSLMTFSGERYDFILNANQTPGTYWIRVRGQVLCNTARIFQVAILQYEDSDISQTPAGPVPSYDDFNTGLQFNTVNSTYNNLVSVTSLAPSDVFLSPQTQLIQRFIEFDFNNVNNPMYYRAPYNLQNVPFSQRRGTPQFDNISFRSPSVPLLPNRFAIRPEDLCEPETIRNQNCAQNFCTCAYVIQFPLNSNVELILIDVGNGIDAIHPIHLHGYAFRVLGSQRLGRNTTTATVRAMDDLGLLQRNYRAPPRKDTIGVPHGGYAIIRFRADNPGFWLMHCHIDTHIEVGMALVIQVGEASDMRSTPPNFPTCGNYSP